MNLSSYANVTLLVAFVFIGMAALGDTLASRQIAASRYKFVPLVKLLRLAQWPAMVAGLVWAVLSLKANPATSGIALLVSALVALVGQARLLTYGGGSYQALMRGFLPAMTISLLLANSGLLPADTPALTLELPALGAALLLAGGYWFVAYQRTQQDLLRLRD